MKCRRFALIFALPLILLGGGESWARAKEGWIFSPITGLSAPKLDILYNQVFLAPFAGQSEIVADLPEDAAGESTYPVEDFLFENNLPRIGVGPEAGLEFRRRFGNRNDFFIGVSAWEIGSTGRVSVIFPLQGELNNAAVYERRAKFSYTQFFLGWRHYFRDRSRRVNLYTNLGINELFDIDYTETHVFSFTSGPPAGFQRVAVYRAQATGLLMLQFGAGAEVRINERFSLSFEGAYVFGLRDVVLKGVETKSDFNPGDRLAIMPAPIGNEPLTNNVSVLSRDGLSRSIVYLNLDGWRVAAKLNVFF